MQKIGSQLLTLEVIATPELSGAGEPTQAARQKTPGQARYPRVRSNDLLGGGEESYSFFAKIWLFRYLITASIHGHFRPMPHESASYSRGYGHTHLAW